MKSRNLAPDSANFKPSTLREDLRCPSPLAWLENEDPGRAASAAISHRDASASALASSVVKVRTGGEMTLELNARDDGE